MNYCEHVIQAQAGSSRDFADLVELFQTRLDSYLRRWIRSSPDREEVLMDSFFVAWERLAQLKNPQAFPSWLWAIGRTQAWKHLRRSDPHLVFGLDVENLASTQDQHSGGACDTLPAWEAWSQSGAWKRILDSLSPIQWEAVELHHTAGFSCRETALICQTSEARIKSRLHEARQTIRRVMAAQGTAGAKIPAPKLRRVHPSPKTTLKEIIMTRIDTLKLGSHVFERLSLADQTSFARTILAGTAFAPELLAALGRIDRGREFLALYGQNLGIKELVGILNHCDRFTESRFMRHLEVTCPDEAEAIKQQLFVFEDFAICDGATLRMVYAQVDDAVVLSALAGTTPDLRAHLLSGFDAPGAAKILASLPQADASLQAVRMAQEELIAVMSDLAETGRIRLTMNPDLPTAVASIHPA